MITKTNRLPGILICAVVLIAVLTACETVPAKIDTPEGFAEYKGAESSYRAITPEGVVLRVRSVPNEPVQDLDFWAEALEVQLAKAGYILLDESTFSSPAGDGKAFEWNAPVNGEDWVYLTAIAVGPDLITIAEAAGEFSHYRRYADSIEDNLSSLEPAPE